MSDFSLPEAQVLNPLGKNGGPLAGGLFEIWQQHQQEAEGVAPPLARLAAPSAITAGSLAEVRDGYVTVDIFAPSAADAAAAFEALEALGMLDGVRFEYVISGRLPVAALGAVAAIGNIGAVMPAVAIANVGSVDGEGDEATNADDVRAFFGFDGSGVTVGIISDSFNSLGGQATSRSSTISSIPIPLTKAAPWRNWCTISRRARRSSSTRPSAARRFLRRAFSTSPPPAAT